MMNLRDAWEKLVVEGAGRFLSHVLAERSYTSLSTLDLSYFLHKVFPACSLVPCFRSSVLQLALKLKEQVKFKMTPATSSGQLTIAVLYESVVPYCFIVET